MGRRWMGVIRAASRFRKEHNISGGQGSRPAPANFHQAKERGESLEQKPRPQPKVFRCPIVRTGSPTQRKGPDPSSNGIVSERGNRREGRQGPHAVPQAALGGDLAVSLAPQVVPGLCRPQPAQPLGRH